MLIPASKGGGRWSLGYVCTAVCLYCTQRGGAEGGGCREGVLARARLARGHPRRRGCPLAEAGHPPFPFSPALSPTSQGPPMAAAAGSAHPPWRVPTRRPPRRSRPALRRRRPRTSDWGVPAATNRPQAPAHTHLPLFLWPNLVESAESWPPRTPCARHPGQMRSRTSFTCAGPRGASSVEGTRHRWNNWVFSELRRRSTGHARSSLSVRTSGCTAAELTTSPFGSTKKHEKSTQPLNLASL